MIYTSGIISDIDKEESLEQLQDNKLAIVCEKIGLELGERLLDIGCGWGTLAKFASVNYGAHATGVTLGRNQTAWGNNGLRKSGISEQQSNILCMDYRDIPIPEGRYNKITCLEMAEHVGVRHFSSFLRQVYDMLDDDGVFFLQIAGLRKCWQYEDLIWGLFMNKYIFPGADASTPLGWFVDQLEGAGFEIKGIDTIGVHYSATLWRWYRNWMANREKVEAKYGNRWFRVRILHPQRVMSQLKVRRSGNTSSPTQPSSPAKAPLHATRSLSSRISTPPIVSRVSRLSSALRVRWLLRRLLWLLTRRRKWGAGWSRTLGMCFGVISWGDGWRGESRYGSCRAENVVCRQKVEKSKRRFGNRHYCQTFRTFVSQTDVPCLALKESMIPALPRLVRAWIIPSINAAFLHTGSYVPSAVPGSPIIPVSNPPSQQVNPLPLSPTLSSSHPSLPQTTNPLLPPSSRS